MPGSLPLIVIVGPTAVGKTELAIAIARAIDGEILSADSRQIYRHMNIGTAKPTKEQLAAATHHLIDLVDPDEGLSLAQFQKQAYQVIHDIHARHKTPLLVGGTGQYVTAVVEGWSIPEVAPNEALRSELEKFAEIHGANALHQKLVGLDPVAASNIDGRNVRRVIRALEVCIETGKPISTLQTKQPPPFRMLHIGLTMDREMLYARANIRLNMMLAEGFVEEVNTLLQMGYGRELPSMSGLGYSELAAHILDGLGLEEAIAQAKNNTHDFIRRQFTWFRGHDPGILWHNMENNIIDEVLNSINHWLVERP